MYSVASGPPGPISMNLNRTHRIASFVHGDDGFGNTFVYNQETMHVERDKKQKSSKSSSNNYFNNSRSSKSDSASSRMKYRRNSSLCRRSDRVDSRSAAQVIVDIIKKNKANSISILALGNLTNIVRFTNYRDYSKDDSST